MSTGEVIARLDGIRPGFRAQAGDLAKPTSVAALTPQACDASPAKSPDRSAIGIRVAGTHPVKVTLGDQTVEVDQWVRLLNGSVGEQVHLPSGQCVSFARDPAYLEIR